jgi:hypothetical protein
MFHIWERGEVHNGFCWGNFRERDYLEDLALDGLISLKWASNKWDGPIWLRIGTGGGNLRLQ